MVENALENLCKGLRVILSLLMMTLAIPVVMGVVSRYTPLMPTYLWTEELATFIFIWMVMIGSMVAVWDGTHFDVRVLPDAKRPLTVLLQNGFVLVLVLAFGLIFAIYGVEYAEFGFKQNSVMMRANKLITHISVPLAGAAWAVFAGYRLYETITVYRQTRGNAL
jgi:TRAP-type transport system small permease protein